MSSTYKNLKLKNIKKACSEISASDCNLYFDVRDYSLSTTRSEIDDGNHLLVYRSDGRYTLGYSDIKCLTLEAIYDYTCSLFVIPTFREAYGTDEYDDARIMMDRIEDAFTSRSVSFHDVVQCAIAGVPAEDVFA